MPHGLQQEIWRAKRKAGGPPPASALSLLRKSFARLFQLGAGAVKRCCRFAVRNTILPTLVDLLPDKPRDRLLLRLVEISDQPT
jgi:hypothetical protein